MSLQDQVLAVLKEGAEKIRADLWQPEDLHALELVAQDLVQLGAEAAAVAGDDAKLALVKRKATFLLRHAELLALRRAAEMERTVREEIERVFKDVVLPALIGLLPAVL